MTLSFRTPSAQTEFVKRTHYLDAPASEANASTLPATWYRQAHQVAAEANLSFPGSVSSDEALKASFAEVHCSLLEVRAGRGMGAGDSAEQCAWVIGEMAPRAAAVHRSPRNAAVSSCLRHRHASGALVDTGWVLRNRN